MGLARPFPRFGQVPLNNFRLEKEFGSCCWTGSSLPDSLACICTFSLSKVWYNKRTEGGGGGGGGGYTRFQPRCFLFRSVDPLFIFLTGFIVNDPSLSHSQRPRAAPPLTMVWHHLDHSTKGTLGRDLWHSVHSNAAPVQLCYALIHVYLLVDELEDLSMYHLSLSLVSFIIIRNQTALCVKRRGYGVGVVIEMVEDGQRFVKNAGVLKDRQKQYNRRALLGIAVKISRKHVVAKRYSRACVW